MNLANFDDDVFISYAHLDNKPRSPGQEGWITEFHQSLEDRVAQLIGGERRIWRDPELQGNDVLGEELKARISSVALLVSVLSPRYIKSPSCLLEVEQFLQANQSPSGVQVGTKSRMFKVELLPTPRQEHPAPLHSLLGYEFYELDPQTKRPREFTKIFGAEAERAFWMQLNDLAWDIKELLQTMEEDAAQTEGRCPDGAGRCPDAGRPGKKALSTWPRRLRI